MAEDIIFHDDYDLPSIMIHGYRLDCIGRGFPEQYDVFKDGKQVAYLRLRYGLFTCEMPDVMGKRIYEAYPQGYGEFHDYERMKYLTQAIEKIESELNGNE